MLNRNAETYVTECLGQHAKARKERRQIIKKPARMAGLVVAGRLDIGRSSRYVQVDACEG